LIANSTTSSLRELTEAVTQLASSDLKEQPVPGRLTPSKPDELGRLTQAYNVMTRQLHHQIIELENERVKSAAVLEEMTDGVIMVDSIGRVQMINPAAGQMFNLKGDEVMGHTLAEGLRHFQVVDLWQRCRDTGSAQTATMEISTSRLYLHGIATPLDQSSIPGSILLIFQNLTQQRYLETVRSDFISNISHELRTPLASLKALTETLHEGALEDPPAAKRFLRRMENEVDALTQMVSELLELARIESGRVPLEIKPTSPEDILYPSVDRLREQAERAGLDIQVECRSDLPLIMVDQGRLEQVLVNLLHNAIKFTPAGGAVTLRAEIRDCDEGADDCILFSVEDTGVGIPDDDLPRIFERFYKADRARSSRGTGLGLAIAKHTVEAHQGRIWAKSREGYGSTFYFTIPLASQVLLT
jgi:two-component system phosphate regulon sensor histidine kinase PhoR